MGTRYVSKSQFKAKALELFREVEKTGEPIVITDNGAPKLEVRPYRNGIVEALQRLRGSVLWYDGPFDPAVPEEDWEVLNDRP